MGFKTLKPGRQKLSRHKPKQECLLPLLKYSFWVKPAKILSSKQNKTSPVDCVTAVLIIDACLKICWASRLKISDHSGFVFFPPSQFSCPPQSLKESHNVWIATYHTQACKKLNLHSLRWMLCWSGHFAFQSHYIAVMLCSSSAQRRETVVVRATAIIQFQWLSRRRYEITRKYM